LSFHDQRSVKAAWAGWAVLAVATAVIIAMGSGRTVVPAYREGAVFWMAGRKIYSHLGVGGFVYLPQAAVLFIPFALLPVMAGEVVWRLVNIGVFALGIFRFADLVRGQSGREWFPLMTLVTLPLAWDCARNGQATLAMTGLMLLAVTDIARERRWRAALWISLGIAVKPLVIVLALLVMAIDRPLSWRVPAALAVTALVPFLTQHPAYVLDQYAVFWSSLTTAVHVGAVDKGWTTPFNALRVLGITVPEKAQTILRVTAAFGTLALCWLSRRKHDAVRSAVFLFSFAVVYLMLFSPRTENNTYAMLGPVIGVFLAGAAVRDAWKWDGALLAGIACAILGGRMIERLVTPHAGTSWVSPLMAACFAGYLLAVFFRSEERQETPFEFNAAQDAEKT
jgi:alpha-1,2-mannosyltransferase